ncbi:unnamed protein product [Closterium sp. Naga37s-1]|nr:unnamed protein product [Closterium sp. Naga37s-1]
MSSGATIASGGATIASSGATIASSGVTIASTRATIASTRATIASTRATIASSRATIASTRATIASTKATIASTRATIASSGAKHLALPVFLSLSPCPPLPFPLSSSPFPPVLLSLSPCPPLYFPLSFSPFPPVLLSLSPCPPLPFPLSSSPFPPVLLSLSPCPPLPFPLSSSPFPPVLLSLSPCPPLYFPLSFSPFPPVLLSLSPCPPLPFPLSSSPFPPVLLSLSPCPLPFPLSSSLFPPVLLSLSPCPPLPFPLSSSPFLPVRLSLSPCRSLPFPLSSLPPTLPPPLSHPFLSYCPLPPFTLLSAIPFHPPLSLAFPHYRPFPFHYVLSSSPADTALLLLISAASLVSCEQRLSYSGFATNEDGVLVAKQSRVTLFKRNSPNAKSSSSNGKSAFAKKQKQAEAEMIAAASKRTKSPKKARSFSSIFGSLVSAPAAQDTPVAAAPSLTIFCSPKPYSSVLDPKDPQPDNQIRALRSWLRLTPSPKIVLLGNDSTFTELARRFPKQVSVESAIDTNYYGLPQFHSIVARAQAADTDLSMIINGDIILLNNVLDAINKVHKTFPHWVMTAARWDVAEDFPYTFFPSMWANARSRGPAALEKEIAEYARTKGSLHTYGGVDFWVWNNSPVQLHTGIMPPFAFGRGKYDNWFTHEIVASGLREVVDASDAVTSIHVAHSYSHVTESAETKNGAAALAGKNFWSTRKKSSWELFANIHLAQTHGSYSNQLGTALHVPWKMSSCFEPAVNNMCLQRRLRPATCQCEYSNFVDISQSDPKIDPSGRRWTCGSVSVDKKSDYSIQAVPTPGSAVGLPHTAAQLLPQVAREVGGLKVVILVAVTMGYAEMLMSFVCRLRGLGLADNLVVAALDEDLYRFAFSQGLAVYHEQVSAQCDPDLPFLGFLSSLLPHVVPHSVCPSPRRFPPSLSPNPPPSLSLLPSFSSVQVSVGYQGLNSKDCVFGSQCFRQFTKLKSRSVLKVLKQGYSVLWTDVDIVWFSDPLPDLLSYGPGTFPIQSNEPNGSIPGTGIRRINSGFYFARSDPKTIEAFEAITAHAATTKLSEQPSFYDILCGVKGENLVAGKEECRWQNGLRTIFLDRKVYPNGAVHNYWDHEDVLENCLKHGCTILHNNWIAGKDAKKNRFMVNKFWHYDPERRMCTWRWHSKLPTVAHADSVQAQ